MPIKNELVLSGGGTNGVAMLGALHALESRGCLAGVRRLVGTSVGGIIALLASDRGVTCSELPAHCGVGALGTCICGA